MPFLRIPGVVERTFIRDARLRAHVIRTYDNALAGDGDAQASIGFYYEIGEIFPRDPAKAIYWYRQAVQAGYLPARNSIAGAYLKGLGVRKNAHKAVSLYKQSAAEGDAAAVRNLGFCYFRGLGVRRNEKRGFGLLKKSYDLGLRSAAIHLARCFAGGHGVGKNRSTAVRWYLAAIAEDDNSDAAFELSVQLFWNAKTAKQFAEARRYLKLAIDRRQSDAITFADVSPEIEAYWP